MPKTRRVELRLDEEEWAAWKEAAHKEYRSLAAWIRLRCSGPMQGNVPRTTIPPKDPNVREFEVVRMEDL